MSAVATPADTARMRSLTYTPDGLRNRYFTPSPRHRRTKTVGEVIISCLSATMTIHTRDRRIVIISFRFRDNHVSVQKKTRTPCGQPRRCGLSI